MIPGFWSIVRPTTSPNPVIFSHTGPMDALARAADRETRVRYPSRKPDADTNQTADY
ncbi:MAG: hypothetical protein R3C43_15890 [Chloroflexota bacterium]